MPSLQSLHAHALPTRRPWPGMLPWSRRRKWCLPSSALWCRQAPENYPPSPSPLLPSGIHQGGHLVLLHTNEAFIILLGNGLNLGCLLKIHREGVVHVLQDAHYGGRCWVVGCCLLGLLVVELRRILCEVGDKCELLV